LPAKNVYTTVEDQKLKLSNLDKLIYKESEISKAEIIQYALKIAPFMLPYVKGRPLTLIRFPDGIGLKRFYTKNKPSWTPDWMPYTTLPWDEENDYLVANETPHLVWLANLAALEIHTMNSTLNNIEKPNQFIIDLDPPENENFESVKTLAFELKSFLEDYDYPSFAKLSGGKGIHISVPIKTNYSYDDVIKSVKGLMKTFITTHPNATLFVHKEKRKGKTLLDIYRNHPGNTTIAPYSLRGKIGAPVSMPLSWNEIEKAKTAQDFNLNNVFGYLKEKGCAWKNFYKNPSILHNQKTQVAVQKNLKEYNWKRDFTATLEPSPDIKINANIEVDGKFVIHIHQATNLHYDLRLGSEGVLKSWAIPKGLPIEKDIKRLAIQTEDHPAKYIDFEGIIPKEEYGGGQMWVFETGTFEWLKKTKTSYKIKLKGKQIEATYSLYKMKAGDWIVERSESTDLSFFVKGIQPMLCDAAKKLPTKATNYLYEIKWDGIRAIWYKRKDEIQLISRSGRSIIDRFPEFNNPKIVKVENAIIDCELVCLDEKGKPVFSDVISRMHLTGTKNIASATKTKPAYLYAFDCLYLDGLNLCLLPLQQRKAWLNTIFKSGNITRLSETLEDGKALFEASRAMGLEGIMAKQLEGKYYPGDRSNTWQKIKHRQTFEALIIGYTKGKGDRIDLFGALHLAKPIEDGWQYFGKVGTGFGNEKMKQIWKQLKVVATIKKPIKESVEEENRTTWIEPNYCCKVEFASFSSNNTLREPVFLDMWLVK